LAAIIEQIADYKLPCLAAFSNSAKSDRQPLEALAQMNWADSTNAIHPKILQAVITGYWFRARSLRFCGKEYNRTPPERRVVSEKRPIPGRSQPRGR
jgi:hypothetical protein